ncbi:MAG: adenylate/guanylate cyclase domain-containing protein [Microcystaceae cyanobacterium]
MNRTIRYLRKGISNLLFKHTIPTLIAILCICIGIRLTDSSLFWDQVIHSHIQVSSEARATAITRTLELYSQAVTTSLNKDQFISTLPNYRDKENNVPNPGSFIMDLSNTLEEDTEGLSVRFYSDYPWPWRKNKGKPLNDFEKEALSYLEQHPENNYFDKIKNDNRGSIYQYAKAIRMSTSCIACHNTDINSPKKDWNVGDFAGAISIITDLNKVKKVLEINMRSNILFMGLMFVFIVSAIALVARRFNLENKELEMRVQERTANLLKANDELAELNGDLEKRNVLIRQVFGRYVSDEIVANLLESSNSLNMGGERRYITILTSDLRGFTAISERLSAEEVITILNIYLEKMADIINQYNGTINEIMGDGMLVLFGAPTERGDDAPRAIACAVAMQLAMTDINQKLKRLSFPQLEMGIGINTGLVILGNIGSEKRTKYGVVGSQVNLTYRIESFSLGGEVLLAESTYNECHSMITVGEQKQVQAKGIKEIITLYELEGIAGSYNLFLPPKEEVFRSLSNPIAVEYQVLEEKHLDLTMYSGQFTKLSRRGAKIVLDSDNPTTKPTAFTNIKLNLCHLPETSEDIYAKVSEQESESNSFYIHFTSRTPRLEKIIGITFSD